MVRQGLALQPDGGPPVEERPQPGAERRPGALVEGQRRRPGVLQPEHGLGRSASRSDEVRTTAGSNRPVAARVSAGDGAAVTRAAVAVADVQVPHGRADGLVVHLRAPRTASHPRAGAGAPPWPSRRPGRSSGRRWPTPPDRTTPPARRGPRTPSPAGRPRRDPGAAGPSPPSTGRCRWPPAPNGTSCPVSCPVPHPTSSTGSPAPTPAVATRSRTRSSG